MHDSLLNHMTIITELGASYVDHMNDDVPEVNSFSRECYQALSSTHFWGDSLGMRLHCEFISDCYLRQSKKQNELYVSREDTPLIL